MQRYSFHLFLFARTFLRYMKRKKTSVSNTHYDTFVNVLFFCNEHYDFATDDYLHISILVFSESTISKSSEDITINI